MKIAMMTINYKPFTGGVPISVERQARYLTELGHDVTVFAPAYGVGMTENENRACYREIWFRTRQKKLENGMNYPCFSMPEITAVFAEESFDCIHVHHPVSVGNLALYLGKKYKIPVIYTYHTRYEDYLHYLGFFREVHQSGRLRRMLYRFAKQSAVPGYMTWFTNRCDLVFAPTPEIKRLIREQGTRSKIQVLPTGLEPDFYRPDPGKSMAIRRRFAGEKQWLFCTVGRLEEEKNPGFLLEGIRILRQRLGDRFRMLFIGEGSMKKRLQEEAEAKGIAETVVFVGNLPNQEIKHYLNAADLFLFASTSETQGIVLAEAMAAGCPVVAVKASGVNDIVEDGKNGHISEEIPELWAGEVEKALRSECMEKLKSGARKTAETYRADWIASKEAALYMQCIEESTEAHFARKALPSWRSIRKAGNVNI